MVFRALANNGFPTQRKIQSAKDAEARCEVDNPYKCSHCIADAAMGKNWRKMGADSFQKMSPEEFDGRWKDTTSEVDSDGNDACMHH